MNSLSMFGLESRCQCLRASVSMFVAWSRADHRHAWKAFRTHRKLSCLGGDVSWLRLARQFLQSRDYWMSRARAAHAELRALESALAAEIEVVPESAPVVVRVVSAVPVAPVQLTLSGGVDPVVPARAVRPSWYSRSRVRGRYLPGRCL